MRGDVARESAGSNYSGLSAVNAVVRWKSSASLSAGVCARRSGDSKWSGSFKHGRLPLRVGSALHVATPRRDISVGVILVRCRHKHRPERVPEQRLGGVNRADAPKGFTSRAAAQLSEGFRPNALTRWRCSVVMVGAATCAGAGRRSDFGERVKTKRRRSTTSFRLRLAARTCGAMSLVRAEGAMG